MKRYGNLWQDVISFEALLHAAEEARRGKRFRPAVASFHFNLEHELWKLHEELSTKKYKPGAYRSFFIYEPKQRQISAAPFRDRFVHYALTTLRRADIEPTISKESIIVVIPLSLLYSVSRDVGN
jgi:RNA-directed DNA polymerase